MISIEQLTSAIPKAGSNATKYLDHLNKTFEVYSINTPERMAAFLAQVAHESANLSRVEENLRYTAPRLLSVFPKYFTEKEAEVYANNPQRIASRVYARRLGNGDEGSGDGWTFRGRGLIQITGRVTYRACGEAVGIDLENNPDVLVQPDLACLSAGWYWSVRGLNPFADKRDMIGITKAVNGGMNGYTERLAAYEFACLALNVAPR